LSIWKCRRTLLAVLWAVRFWDMEVTIDAGQHPFLEENASLTLIVCYYDCVALDLMEIGAIAGEICTFEVAKVVLRTPQMRLLSDVEVLHAQKLVVE